MEAENQIKQNDLQALEDQVDRRLMVAEVHPSLASPGSLAGTGTAEARRRDYEDRGRVGARCK